MKLSIFQNMAPAKLVLPCLFSFFCLAGLQAEISGNYDGFNFTHNDRKLYRP